MLLIAQKDDNLQKRKINSAVQRKYSTNFMYCLLANRSRGSPLRNAAGRYAAGTLTERVRVPRGFDTT